MHMLSNFLTKLKLTLLALQFFIFFKKKENKEKILGWFLGVFVW